MQPQEESSTAPKAPLQLQWYHLGGPTRNVTLFKRQFECKSLLFCGIGIGVISTPFPAIRNYSNFAQKYANIEWKTFSRVWLRSAAATLPYIIVSRSLGDYPNRDEARLMEFTMGIISGGIAFGNGARLWNASSIQKYKLAAVPHLILSVLGVYLAQDAAFWHFDRQKEKEQESQKE
jgi:hypothetical protein